MKKFISLCFVPLLFAVVIQPAAAQFEGTIHFNSYEVSPDGDREKSDDFIMYVTPDRIMLQGSGRYELMGSIKTEGILVRLDYEDFVFLSGDANAIKISKSDITSMMNMFGNGSGSSQKELDETDVNYEKTEEAENIHGFKAEKYIFREKGKDDEHSEVWMTNRLDINWGMLSEPWGSLSEAKIGSGLPTDLIFKENYFPLKMEFYKNGRLTGVTEVSEFSRSSVARAMVQVPPGVKVLSFQDYLFQKMSEN